VNSGRNWFDSFTEHNGNRRAGPIPDGQIQIDHMILVFCGKKEPVVFHGKVNEQTCQTRWMAAT
jgi:hypothetical protein